MKRRHMSVCTLGLLVLAAVSTAQPIDIADRLEPIRAEHQLPALVALVTTADQTVAIGAVGVRQFGNDTPVTTDDLWHLGSCAKAMTGTLAAVLVERGKIRWDTTIADIFDGEVADLHDKLRGATLEQLMGHRAGLPTIVPADIWAQAVKQEGSVREQRDRFVHALLARAPASTPGTKYEYSNLGVTIAGAMLERASGGDQTTWEELIVAVLFKPLGIDSAGFGPPGTPDTIAQPRGHRPAKKRGDPPTPVFADNPPAISPAGRAHMTIEHWAIFIREHLRGRQGNSDLLPTEAFEYLHTAPAGQHYSAGWVLLERPWGGRVISHAGSNTLWYCVVWAAPDSGFAVLIATNIGGDAASKATDKAASQLIKAFNAGEFKE